MHAITVSEKDTIYWKDSEEECIGWCRGGKGWKLYYNLRANTQKICNILKMWPLKQRLHLCVNVLRLI